MRWTSRLYALAQEDGFAVRAVIVSTAGPTPRSVGAALIVTASRQEGRIGRPELTTQVVEIARAKLDVRRKAEPHVTWTRHHQTFATGTVLGEATGGSVEILIEVFGPAEISHLAQIEGNAPDDSLLVRPMASGNPVGVCPPGSSSAHSNLQAALEFLELDPTCLLALGAGRTLLVERLAPRLTPFHVYGTGLVARALVPLLADLPFEVVWHDRAPAHFPDVRPDRVRLGRSDSPAAAAGEATSGSFHAVMTGDHAEDLAVCRVLARAGSFRFLGVIGAPMKRERLMARLAADGIGAETLSRIACPIGLPGIRGKDPAIIAVSIAAQALTVLQRTDHNPSAS